MTTKTPENAPECEQTALPEPPKRRDKVHDKLKEALTRRGIPHGQFNRRPKRKA